MEAGAIAVESRERDDGSACGADEHARDSPRRVTVLAKDVADARAVTGADCCEIDSLARMVDHEIRVVVDPRAGVERANEVVGLFPGRRRKAEPLVERPDPLDDSAPQKDGERDRPVPDVLARESRGLAVPPRLAPGHAVEALDARRDTLEQIGWVDAVVVGEGHHVRTHARQEGVSGTGQARRRLESLDLEPGVPRQDARRPVVAVLVGDEDPKVAVRLGVERRQQAVQLGDAVDRRDDEIECHGRTLTAVPLVSVLLAVHNDARFLDLAVASVLGQTLDDLELVVVDDASTDETPAALAALDDPRVVTLRNDEQLGLAASLNRGLERSAGRYVARLDADDVAHPRRLELQLERMRAEPALALLGSAVLDLVDFRPGELHVSPSGTLGVRWLSLFSSPVFHPTVLVDREVLDAHGLRYDPEFLESEDYDLWTRLLRHAEGANLTEPLVLKRVHAGQATARRGDLQASFAAQVSLREIAQVAPGLSGAEAETARLVGLGEDADAGPFLALLRAFESRHGRDTEVRDIAARMVMRAGRPQHALGLGPTHALRAVRAGAHRRRRAPGERRDAAAWLGRLGSGQTPRGQTLGGSG